MLPVELLELLELETELVPLELLELATVLLLLALEALVFELVPVPLELWLAELVWPLLLETLEEELEPWSGWGGSVVALPQPPRARATEQAATTPRAERKGRPSFKRQGGGHSVRS